MSRHRNVRTMNYDDEYDDDDDYHYGHSVEDECISPTDAQQWIYDRAKGQQSMSAFLANNRDIEEEDDDDLEAERGGTEKGKYQRRDSECYQLPELDEEERIRLVSCMDEIRNIVGEAVTDRQLVEAIMKHNYDFNNALDEVLNNSKTPPASGSAGIANKSGQEPVEKDFKIPQLSKLGTGHRSTLSATHFPRFNLPTVRLGAGFKPEYSVPKAGTNLSDLVKSRMGKQETDSGSESDTQNSDYGDAGHALVPKLSDLSLTSDSGAASSSPAESTFSNLTELARFHLQSKSGTPVGSPLSIQSGGFTVPNLFNTPSVARPPGLSSTLKPKTQTPLAKKDWIVDLKSALIKDKSEITPRRKAVHSQDVENEEPINYGFVDCDIVETKPVIDEFCSIDCSAVMVRQLNNVTSICSGMGSVLCTRFRKRDKTRVQHGFIVKPGVMPFRFNVPSPDDVVLGHMKKIKR